MPWLWLLKIWNPFSGFVKKYWKIIAIVVAIVATYFFINHHINALKKKAYDSGVQVTNQQWNVRVKAEDDANRKYEQLWQGAIDDFGKKFDSQQAERIKETTTHTDTIHEIIKNDPNSTTCKVSQKVLDERNAIRHLGPTGQGIEQ